MSRGPQLDEIEIRAAIQAGVAALETQMKVLGRAHTIRLGPGQRRYVRSVIHRLARRIVALGSARDDHACNRGVQWYAPIRSLSSTESRFNS